MSLRFKISQIVEQALFDKAKGYYQTQNPLGSEQDFITAPEISQIFGEVIASYLLNFFSQRKQVFSLVEMGAGRGFLYRDILQTIFNLAKKNNILAQDFLNSASFDIIEINPVLKKIQQENLKKFSDKISINWHQNFSQFENKIHLQDARIFFISNELLDCFAIDQFVKTDIGWCERLIEVDDQENLSNPRFVIDNFSPKINQFVIEKLGYEIANQAKINAVFEYSKSLQDFYFELCQCLKKYRGIALNCDYGYNQYSDFANTLQAVKHHQKIPVLQALSGCDITGHVDFFALDKIAHSFKLSTSIVTQRQFLLELGGFQRCQNLSSQNPLQAQQISQAFERLVSPQEMGELFKFHVIWQ